MKETLEHSHCLLHEHPGTQEDLVLSESLHFDDASTNLHTRVCLSIK